MDHLFDSSVAELLEPTINNFDLLEEISTVVGWIEEFGADDKRKLTIDKGYRLYQYYMNFDEQNQARAAFLEKFSRKLLRIESVAENVDGSIQIPDNMKYLDEKRQLLFGVALSNRAKISIVNATHENWHLSRSFYKTHSVLVDNLLEDWLEKLVNEQDRESNQQIQQSYYSPPSQLCGNLAEARCVAWGSNYRKAWEDKQCRYEFDRQHNTVEVYQLSNGEWLHEAELDGRIRKRTGGKGRRWGKK